MCSWLVVNKLTLNIEKTNYIIFRPRQKTIPFHPNIKIINNNSNTSQPLEMKNYIRYLGILIDSNLSWKFHIDYVCQKVSKTIGIIAKLRHFVPRHVLLTLYRSLILPYISYSICAWGHATTGGDNSNKGCLGSPMDKFMSSRKFRRPSRIFRWHSP